MPDPLRVAILTMRPGGFSAICAEKILKTECVRLVGVVIDEQRVTGRRRHFLRRLKKFLKLGPLALVPAMWVRRQARLERDIAGAPLDRLAAARGVPVLRVPSVNSAAVGKALKEWKADLALSLTNSLMKERTFAAARLGTLNVHHGKVPEFRGSPPVLWEIYEGASRVGWTIHRIEAGVDTGPVLKTGEVPLEIADTLEETYRRTRRAVFESSAQGLVELLGRIAAGEFAPVAQEKTGVPARTTPTYRQWRRIRRQFERMVPTRRDGAG